VHRMGDAVRGMAPAYQQSYQRPYAQYE